MTIQIEDIAPFEETEVKPQEKEAAKQQEAKAEAMTEPKDEKKKVVWQFRYRNYQEVIPIVDPEAAPTLTGKKPRMTIKARNFKLELDLRDEGDRKRHKALQNSSQCGVSFWLVSNEKKKLRVTEKGATLRKLMKMPEVQLRGMLTDEEFREAGIDASADRFDIAMAIISGNKQLVGQPEKESTQ